jgi:formamidopyrimidine-DNA glycosylase
MPELPDVEVFRGYLQATGLHQPIERAEPADQRLLRGVGARRLRETLRGNSLVATDRHGKHLFAALEKGGFLVLHFGMTGFLRYYRDEEKRPEHAGLVLHFRDGYHLALDSQRRLGEVSLAESVAGFAEKRGLGPDALDPELDCEAFAGMIGGRRGMVKTALMNQQALAGVGNVYADEALYQAGLHPQTPARSLDAQALGRLFRTLRRVLATAIERGADPARLPGSWLLPRREPGAECPRCGGKVAKLTVSGRPTYLCPACQPGPGS